MEQDKQDQYPGVNRDVGGIGQQDRERELDQGQKTPPQGGAGDQGTTDDSGEDDTDDQGSAGGQGA